MHMRSMLETSPRGKLVKEAIMVAKPTFTLLMVIWGEGEGG